MHCFFLSLLFVFWCEAAPLESRIKTPVCLLFYISFKVCFPFFHVDGKFPLHTDAVITIDSLALQPYYYFWQQLVTFLASIEENFH